MNEFSRFFFPAVTCVFAISAIFPLSVLADASIEEQAQSMAKKYGSGNVIELACGPKGSRKCVIETTIGKKKRQLRIDFGSYRIRPDMQQISLYVQSLDGSEYSFRVGVSCQDEDMALVPETIGIAECVADFRVVGGKVEGQPRVQIFPITTQKLFRSIKSED
jgi:hypothetical protein